MWKSLFNLLHTSFMWLFQVKFSSMITPRNLMCEVLQISWLWNLILSGWLVMFFWLDLNIVNEDLSAFRVSLLALNQFVKWVIIIFVVETISFMLLLWKKIVVSSAKSLVFPSGQHFGKSLIKIRKRRGPSTDPWGTR